MVLAAIFATEVVPTKSAVLGRDNEVCDELRFPDPGSVRCAKTVFLCIR